MINERKLDEVIGRATYEPEKHCAYPFEEYCSNPKYQKHVCKYVSKCLMPDFLAEYLYEDCYYDDIETVKSNLNYINSAMPQQQFYETWIDITMEMILENIEEQRKEADEREAILTENLSDDDLGELIDGATEKCE